MTPAAAAAPRRPRLVRAHWLSLGVLLLSFAAAGISWWQGERSRALLREQALVQAQKRALQLADAMSGQVGALVSAIDLALQQLRREWEEDPARFDAVARAILKTLPEGAVTHVTVVDASGQTVYNSLEPGRVVNVADREHFKVHLGGVDRLHVGKPVFSRLGQTWTYIANRPLLQSGRFAGTMNLSVSAAFVSSKLAALALSPDDVVALVHRDGDLMARSRDYERSMGQQLSASRPFLADPQAVEGLFRTSGQVDGIDRLYAWHRIPELGFVVAVGLAESQAIAPLVAGLQRERDVMRGLAALIVLSGLTVAALLWRSARREQELERSERRYRTLVDASPDAIYINRDGLFAYLNPAAVRLFGARDADELVGRPVLDLVHPAEHDDVRERARILVERREAVPPVERRMIRVDGQELDVEVTAAPYADDTESGRQVVVRDISERIQARRALERLNAELEQRVEQRTAELRAAKDEAERANRAKSEFLSGMSHELRTPLNAVLGFAQLLEMNGGDARQRRHVEEILRAGRHLLSLIDEVLDLARVEAGRMTVSPEPVALAPLVEDCLGLLEPQARAAAVRIEPPTQCDVHVRADRTRLRQVLLNLLSNAIKYNRPQGRVRVACSPASQPGHIRVCVVDSGIGLDETQRERLFVPFERLGADDRRIAGTGIGLALSKRLVELMGGRIGVDSAPEVGSTFWIELPVVAAAEAEAPQPPMAAPVPSAPPAPRVDVLCIEDNPANLRLVEGIFALRPTLRLVSAATPQAGLELAHRLRPALVLLDINLPEMDGYEVMQCLREDPATRAIPVVAISANAMPADLARARAAGFTDYLTKPLQVPQVLSVLDRAAALPTAAPDPATR